MSAGETAQRVSRTGVVDPAVVEALAGLLDVPVPTRVLPLMWHQVQNQAYIEFLFFNLQTKAGLNSEKKFFP